jgi:hypothetical protein
MAQNFIGCDRDQELLLPPSLRVASQTLGKRVRA